jgi:DNA-directed RNA polymerase subunit N (RpoN/RPB10)
MSTETNNPRRGRPPKAAASDHSATGQQATAGDAVDQDRKQFGDAIPSRCRSCGSTERDPYYKTRVICNPGTDPNNGEPYTHLVLRYTRCRSCGQTRPDRSFENRLESTDTELDGDK